MCSNDKLVKTAVSKLINRWRCCLIPSEVTSKIAYWHLLSTACLKNFWILKRPGMVILRVLGHSFSPILNLIPDKDATLKPASSKISVIKITTVVLPLVPVTPITFSFLEGKPYKQAPKNAKHQWCQPSKKEGINFLINCFMWVIIA